MQAERLQPVSDRLGVGFNLGYSLFGIGAEMIETGERTLVIVLPLPHKNLSPNARCHWRPKAERVKRYRKDAAIAVQIWMSENERREKTFWRAATIQFRFLFRDKRRRDRDNFTAAMKSALDGFTDAGVWVDDSNVTTLPTIMDVDKNDPRVECYINEVEGK
jgi:crossover junction endodeoxyribonuclease RusA